MGESLKFVYAVVFDVFSLASLQKTAVRTLLAGAYFFTLEYIEDHYFEINFHIPQYIFYLLGYILVTLFYYKIGTSYYRWYDGRKYWSYLGTRGKNLSQQLNAVLDKDDHKTRKWFAKMITNHAYSLKANLRKSDPLEEIYEVEPGFKESLKEIKDKPNHIVSLVADKINQLYKDGTVKQYHFLSLNRYMNDLVEIDEQCKGIRKVPSPSSYAFHLRTFLILFTICLPFGFIHEHNFMMIFIMMVIYGAYEGCMVVTEEMEEPFGLDKYDIPLDDICYSLKKHTHQLLGVELKSSAHY
jgi:ion channel-forming bestrophin family protein